MTTSQKLWLGFGTLVVLLTVCVAALLVRLRTVEADVDLQSNFARPRVRTTLELEINVVGYALAVQEHLSGNAHARAKADQEAAHVELHLAEYKDLATTDRHRRWASAFAARWNEMQTLGRSLLGGDDRSAPQGAVTTFFDHRRGLEKFLDDEVQADAEANYLAHEEATRGNVRNVVGFALVLLVGGGVVAVSTSIAVGRAVVDNERSVIEQAERLRTTLASIGDAVITTDTLGRITNLNAAAESLTGWKNDEAVGRPLDAVFRLVNEDTRQPIESPAPKTLKKVVVGPTHRAVLVAKDGGELHVEDRAAPIRCKDGEIVGCVLVFRDVTARKQIERDLAHTRNLFSEGQRIAHLGSWEYVVATQTTVWSDEQKRIYGLDPAEPSPTYDEMLRRHIHPDDAEALDKAFGAVLRAGGGFENENRIVRPDGVVRFIYNKAQPYFDDAGKLLRYVGATLDVTERKRAESELRDADRRKDEFLATLAHELRNPLAPIRNSLQVMKLARADADLVEQSRAMIERQLEQMVRLVDDLLDVSRISRGKIELRKERVALAEVVNGAVETSRPLIQQMGHELAVTLPKQAVLIDADPTRLAQVFLNLLNNAAKYSDHGGHIALTAERQGSDVVVSVRDSGVGIAADQLSRIFEMFTQVDRSLSKAQGGLGIGLTLAKRLVEMHDGRIEVRSDGPGRGAEFVVRLPLVIEAPAPPTVERKDPAASCSAAPGSGFRILIVDDNKDGADSLSMMLSIMGHDTRTAYDGQEGVDAAEQYRPDVALLDIGLPTLNGYEACRRIRESPWGKQMALIAVTGWGQDEDRRRSRDAGFDHHMVKPVDPSVLGTLLAELHPTKH